MKKIVCLDGYTLNPGDNSWDLVAELGEFICYDRTTEGEAQTIERAKNANIILTNKTPITKNVIDNCQGLEAIAVLATGYNVVDVEYAKEKNIPVMNVPVYGSDTVAEMVFAHIFKIYRDISVNAKDVSEALGWSNNIDWCYWLTPQMELAGKTLGIVGFGNIGQRTGEIGAAFKMRVLAHDDYAQSSPGYEHDMVSLDELLAQSDIISLHCPALPDTINMVDQKFLSKMKKSAVLINTSRGQLVVEEDLAQALNEEIIAAAGVDTLWQEPPAKDNPLLKAKNCNITPHIAWATLDARSRITQVVAENIKSVLDGKPQNVVNG